MDGYEFLASLNKLQGLHPAVILATALEQIDKGREDVSIIVDHVHPTHCHQGWSERYLHRAAPP